MIELFSVFLNIANLKTKIPKVIKYKDIQKLRKDHWSNFGPKQPESQPFILLSKVIQYEEFWYRVVVRFKRQQESNMPPLNDSNYEVSGIAPYAIYKLSQSGVRFDILESYRSQGDDKISDYITRGVPREIVEAAVQNLNHHLAKEEEA